MAEYDTAKLQEQNTKNGRKNMSAAELAVLSNVYGMEAVSEFKKTAPLEGKSETVFAQNEVEDSQSAGWGSSADFFSGLFFWVKTVDFMVNGTQFKGKNGYQVRGGAVPAFDGGVIDFLPASLKGTYQNRSNMGAAGTGARLVVYPKESDTISEIPIDRQVEIGIEDNQPYVRGESSAAFDITKKHENGDVENIHAEGVVFDQRPGDSFEHMKIVLTNPSIVRKKKETEEQSQTESETETNVLVYLDNHGIAVERGTKVSAEEPGLEKLKVENLESALAGSDNSSEEEHAPKIKFQSFDAQFEGDEKNITGEDVTLFENASVDFRGAVLEGRYSNEESVEAFGKDAVLHITPFQATDHYDITLDDEVKIGLLNKKPFLSGEAKNAIELPVKRNWDDDECDTVYASGVSFAVNPGDKIEDVTIHLNDAMLETEDSATHTVTADENGATITAQKEVKRKTAYINREEGLRLQDEENAVVEDEDEDDEDEQDDDEEETLADKISKLWNDDQRWQKLSFIKDALTQYFSTGTVPALKDSPFGELQEKDEEKTGKTDIGLPIKIVPGLQVMVGFSPRYEFSVAPSYVLEDAEDAAIKMSDAGEKIKEILFKNPEEKTRKEKKTKETDAFLDVVSKMKLKVGGALSVKGTLGLDFFAALQATAGYLFTADARLTAGGALEGEAKGELSTNIQMQGGKLLLDPNVYLDLTAGLAFSAALGTEGSIKSQLFNWEKELWKKEFLKVEIAKIDLGSQLKIPMKNGLELGGIEMVKSGISFTVMKKKLADNQWNDLKIITEDEKPAVKILAASAEENIKDIEVLVAQYEELKTLIFKEKGSANQGKDENDISFKKLKENMIIFSGNLESKICHAQKTIGLITQEIEGISNQDKHKKNVEKTRLNIQKHKERLSRMDEWGSQIDTDDEQAVANRDEEALTRYQMIVGGKAAGLQKNSQGAVTAEAKKNFATRENLLNYEKNRQNEKTFKQKHLLTELKNYIDEKQISDLKKVNQDFVLFYMKKTNSDLVNHLSLYHRNKQELLDYEESRKLEKTKKHTDRIERLNLKIAELKLENKMSEGNAAFTKFYEDEMQGTYMLKHLKESVSTDMMLRYEESKLKEGPAAKHYEAVQYLQKLKQEHDKLPEKAQKGTSGTAERTRADVLKEARTYFFQLEKKSDVQDNSYKMASKDDLISYEKNWTPGGYIKKKKSKEAQDRFKVIQEFIWQDELAQRIQESGNGEAHNQVVHEISDERRKNLASVLKNNGMKASDLWDAYSVFQSEEKEQDMKENVSLDTLIEFEQERADKFLTTATEEKTHLEKTRMQAKSESERHQHVHDLLVARKETLKSARASGMSAGVYEMQMKRIKEDYFSGALSGGKRALNEKEVAQDNKELFDQLNDGRLLDAFVIHASLLKDVEQYSGVHKERIQKLEDLDEDLNDMQAWDAYRSMGAGDRFKKEWNKSQKGKIDDINIDQMLRYEQRRLRAESRQGWLTKQEKQIKNMFRDKKVSEIYKGGHYQRFLTLSKMKDEQFKAGETPEEHEKEMLRVYQETLDGGKGYEKYLEDNKDTIITPEMIIKYETGRVTALGEKHESRIKLITGFEGDSLTEDQMRQYRQMAMEDGEGWKDRMNKFVGLIYSHYSTGYDTSLNPQELLTPQMILDYEEEKQQTISAKHQARMDLLQDNEVSEEEIWIKYKELGGGKRFSRENSSEIKQEKDSVKKDYFNYNEIMKYEKTRQNYYEELMKSINEPIEKLNVKKTALDEEWKKAKDIQKEISSLLPEDIFGGRNKLDEQVKHLKDGDQNIQAEEQSMDEAKHYREEVKQTMEKLAQTVDAEELEEKLFEWV